MDFKEFAEFSKKVEEYDFDEPITDVEQLHFALYSVFDKSELKPTEEIAVLTHFIDVQAKRLEVLYKVEKLDMAESIKNVLSLFDKRGEGHEGE